MGLWLEIGVWRERRRELVREAQERALAREARKVREAFAAVDERLAGVHVRWGLSEDEAAVAELLQLNGMPRWVAFEERFIVAERDGRLVGALRYATASKKLALGLLVVDPWAGEARIARALYDGAKRLARELCVAEVTAKTARWGGGYPREAGYRRGAEGWSWRVQCPEEDNGGAGRRGRLASVLAALHLPARGAFRA